jgi:MoxR-like ATPase
MTRYRKRFDPQTSRLSAPAHDRERPVFGADYEYTDELVLAVNVALVTGRLLLLRGEPGAGKSTLAADAARLLKWRYYEQVVSSSTSAEDLLFRMDHVGRIGDAMARKAEARDRPSNYLEPGVLWWAFAPESARLRGADAHGLEAREPLARTWPLEDEFKAPAVVLIDEIDKAEPDFPNALLVPLGSLSFHVRTSNADTVVQASPNMRPLVVVTTNEERDLPPAFVRRCVVVRLSAPSRKEPGPTRLAAIARRHFDEKQLDALTLKKLSDRYFDLRESALKHKLRAPSTAEFLDAARALNELTQRDGGSTSALLDGLPWGFREITDFALWKHPQPPPPASASE